MKRNLFYTVALTLGLVFVATACGDDKKETPNPNPDGMDYTPETASSWHNYMKNVATLLRDDATALYNSWNTSHKKGDSFASIFKAHDGREKFNTAFDCIAQIIDGCVEISDEVGEKKIGDPYKKYMAGNKTEALYSVESWYSWHSRDDYTNNIYSIRNAYYGSMDGKVSTKSISALVAGVNKELDKKVIDAIEGAAKAIQAIPQPFRNNINSKETVAAMEACSVLKETLEKNLKPYIRDHKAINSNEVLDPVVSNYVDVVVLPTYKDLKEKNELLYSAVFALASTPNDANFEKTCKAWIASREPWETSEAFLFGPVDELGLDPNMDSWPLDQNAIEQLLKSQNWKELEWKEGDDEKKVEAAQNVRGFHTLEFLLFKDGNPRKGLK